MATTRIYRTPASASAGTIWTVSMWIKGGATSANQILFSADTGGSFEFRTYVQLSSSGVLNFGSVDNGNTNGSLATTRVFRDPTAWYHLVFVWDNANATSADKMIIYVNGVRETEVTYTAPTTNSRWNMNNRTEIGSRHGGDRFFSGEMSHVHNCDGYAYAASDFGETDATDGMWKIKTSPSVSYGTNGFFLKMEDSSNMDLDSSSNGHTFTTAGTLTATNDNPSNNFCTLNPLFKKVGVTYNFTNGNNVLDTTGGSGWHQAMGTLGASSGKWYYEAYANYSPGAYNTQLGWGSADYLAQTKADGGIGAGISKPSFGLYDVGQLYYSTDSSNTQSTASWAAAWTSGDYLMFAADLDNGRFYVGKNGTWDTTSSSNPAAGTGGYSFTPGGHTYIPMMSLYYQDIITNFGNGYFTTTSAGATNADDNGHGVFKYDVPAGFYAICTKNIKEFG